GYAPPGWRTLASVFPEYDDPLLAESGLVIVGEDGEEKRYDRFRDRVMFPIRNVKGECIGFGGRVLGDEKPKYLNSPETPVFSKGRELYGLFEARAALRDKGYALVTEGYMDVVALAQLGFPNAVATLGTACTPEHVQKLFRFTDSVVFSFDGDAAGRRAARKALDGALPFASDVRSVKFLFLPAEHDPDSFIREFGADAFARFVSEAMPLSRFMLEAAREGCDLGTAEGRAHLASNVRPLWSAMPDGALKRQLLADIAGMVQLGAPALTELWTPAAAPPTRAVPAAAAAGHAAPRYEKESQWRPSGSRYGRDKAAPPPATRGRTLPLGRPDVAARLLLSNMGEWEKLSHELHGILCSLPGAHGELFAWIDHQLHEHGAQPWMALREGLRGLPFESLAQRVMTGPDGAPVDAAADTSTSDAVAELRSVLDYMLDDLLKAQESEAIAAAGTDPLAIERYRALQMRRRELQARLQTGRNKP
ncbi:MAG: DNA primase, partial [Comamonadaceae bacterium]